MINGKIGLRFGYEIILSLKAISTPSLLIQPAAIAEAGGLGGSLGVLPVTRALQGHIGLAAVPAHPALPGGGAVPHLFIVPNVTDARVRPLLYE